MLGHLVSVQLFLEHLKQMSHGKLISSVEPLAALTVQVQGILIETSFIHNIKGHIYLQREMKMDSQGPILQKNQEADGVHRVHTYHCLTGL